MRVLLVALQTLLIAAACGEAPRPEQQGRWYLDLERATEVAYETGRPMLVVFR